MQVEDNIEVLSLTVISYEDFAQSEPAAISALKKALYETGIVAVKGIPGYSEKAVQFIEANRAFSELPQEITENCAPDRSHEATFKGYERGKEKFQRPDGTWVIDDLKNSYYADIPDNASNIWPKVMDLQTPYQALGALMSEMCTSVMEKIGLIGGNTGISSKGFYQLGRMLHYKGANSIADNPLWCGAHLDHGLLTALIPATYFMDGMRVPEPPEAGLFVKSNSDGVYRKVMAEDPELMMFQVGEFAQLLSNDAIRATEHQVRKAAGYLDRYAMAVFIDAAMDTVIHSTSILTKDIRYGGNAGAPCSYQHWHEETFKRFLVDE
jgi:isopenicillin N synthase-like dioxygenase